MAETDSDKRSPMLNHPRVILWIGSEFVLSDDLRRDLPGLSLVAVYSESTDPAIERILRESTASSRRYAVGLTSADEAGAWDPSTVPVFYLNGRDSESMSDLRAAARRASMLERFAVLAEDHRPSVLVLGVEEQDEQIKTILETALDYGAGAPVVMVGRAASLRTSFERIRSRSRLALREPEYVDGGWADLTVRLAEAGISLAVEAHRPSVLVANVHVPLDKLFGDPELRIDHTWRLITTRAIGGAPSSGLERELFEAVMRPDERNNGRTVEEDLYEWWGIAANLLCRRQILTDGTNAVLAELRTLSQPQSAREPRVCWLPAEPGSGSTTLIRQIAFAAASAGFPTLVAKQLARDPLRRQLRDFMTALLQEAAGMAAADSRDAVRSPFLVVLDVPHQGIRGMAELPDELVRVSGRQALTLWAVRVAPGVQDPQSDRVQWLAEQFASDDLEHRPRRGDRVLPILRSRVTPEEVQNVERYARSLIDRGLPVTERTLETWHDFQEKHRYRVADLLRASGLSGEEFAAARQAFDAEPLFWILLYHFLLVGEINPIAEGIRGRLERIPELADDAGVSRDMLTGVLLEIAKTSNWSLPIPQTALFDWLEGHRPGNSEGRNQVAEVPEPPKPLSGEELELAVARLQETGLHNWAKGRASGLAKSAASSTAVALRVALDCLTDQGLARSVSINGNVIVTMPHPVLARSVLIEALDPTSRVSQSLRDAIGGSRAIFFKEKGFEGLTTLLGRLSASGPNIQLCEALSETLLLGDDESEEWRDGRGDERLKAYDVVPRDIRTQSRVLSHHYGLVLRRSTFAKKGTRDKRDRLLLSRQSLERALSLPWRVGVRDEHPAHIRTTLGMVLDEIATFDAENAPKWRAQSRAELRLALLDLPNSRHTRLAMARFCLADAKRVRPDPAHRAYAVRLVAECLQLLSIEPTGRTMRWYAVQKDAAALFGDAEGKRYLDDLRAAGVEDGFLLTAELYYHQDHSSSGARALDCLKSLVEADKALQHPRAARRVADLYLKHPELNGSFDEKYRLLSAVEAKLERLTSHEEFHLAYLAYQLGRYQEGRTRFTRLRASGRAKDVAVYEFPVLTTRNGREPLRCTGQVQRIDGSRGWMAIQSDMDDRVMFDAPFTVRHFAEIVRGRKYPVGVRFSESGPMAVPFRFFRGAAADI